MKNETIQWIKYANENLISSKILLERNLFNPSLQNAQQCCEKYIKAYLIEYNFKLQKTHSILSLNEILKNKDIFLNITEDDIDLIDSIYLTSKYPLGSVLPNFEPDKTICIKCIDIATTIENDIKYYLKISN